MDKILTKIFKNEAQWFKVLLIFVNTVASILCAVITKNTAITVMYIMITGFLNLCAVVYAFPEFEKFFSKILCINEKEKYIFFVGLAILPTLSGLICGELDFSRIASYFDNLPPNLFGALTICSLLHHISKFELEPIVDSFTRTKKIFIMFVMPIVFNFAFLNAINYTLGNELKLTYFFNGIHLFNVVFWGVSVLFIFMCHIWVSPLSGYNGKQLYPCRMLIFLFFFLAFSGIPPIFLKEIKPSLVLLTFNTIAILIAAWFIFFLIVSRTSKSLTDYPWKALTIFSGASFAILGVSWACSANTSNVTVQVISSSIVIIACLMLVFLMRYLMKNFDTVSN